MSEDAGTGADGAGGGGADAGGAGTGAGSFVEQIAPEYRDAVTKAGFTDVNAVVKSWANAESMLGNSLRVPGPDAGAEDWQKFEAKLSAKVPNLVRLPADGDAASAANFAKQLGWPESPAGYNFEKVEGVDEGTLGQLNDWFAGVAHEAKLTQGQAAQVRQGWLKTITEASAQAQAAQEKAAEALRTEWGGSYDQRIALVGETILKLGGDELLAELDSSALGNSPALAKAFMRVREMMGEDRAHGGAPSTLMPTAAELRERIAEIDNNREHPYHHAGKPGHADAVQKRLKMVEQLHAMKGMS